MKRHLTSAVALLALLAPVSAADLLSTKDAPNLSLPVASQTWNGVYVNAGVGGSFTSHELSATGIDLNGIAGYGLIGRVGGGADRQFGRLVFGVFGDYDFSNASTDLTLGSQSASVKLDNQWTVGGRGGFLATPSTLFYGLMGYSNASYSLNAPGFSKSQDFTGMVYGGGMETQLGNGWSGKLEYRFHDFDAQNFGGLTIQPHEQSIVGGFSYKFNVFN